MSEDRTILDGKPRPTEIVKVSRRLIPRGSATVTRKNGAAFQCDLDERFLHEMGGDTTAYFRVELRGEASPLFIRRVPNW